MEIANSIMLYGSEIWAETLEVKKRANTFVSVQRMVALRIASTPAVIVIAGTIPVDLLAAGWIEIYNATSHSRSLQEKHHYKMATTMEQ